MYVKLSDKQIKFRKANPTANIKEVWNMELTPVPEITLEEVREKKLQELDEYNTSTAVNEFTFNGIKMWLTPEERTTLKSRAKAAMDLGVATIRVCWKNPAIEADLPSEDVYKMISALELYAGDSDAVYIHHHNAISELPTKEEINNYDFTVDFPDKLNFK